MILVIKIDSIIKKIVIITIIFQIIFVPISNAAGFWDDIKNTGDEFVQTGEEEAENSERWGS